jgi:hypothetical protein
MHILIFILPFSHGCRDYLKVKNGFSLNDQSTNISIYPSDPNGVIHIGMMQLEVEAKKGV